MNIDMLMNSCFMFTSGTLNFSTDIRDIKVVHDGHLCCEHTDASTMVETINKIRVNHLLDYVV